MITYNHKYLQINFSFEDDLHSSKTSPKKLIDLHKESILIIAEEVLKTFDFSNKIIVDTTFVSKSDIQSLNQQYRNKNKPTNVLSFAQYDMLNETFDDKKEIILGDIIISFDVIVEESKNKKLIDHLLHIWLHGLLHLCGLDHIEDIDAKKMEGLEIKILQKLNISNPYISDV